MASIRHQLKGIDPVLHLLNDDGRLGITIIIHGAAPGLPFGNRREWETSRCSISRAQFSGRVYLLSWRSGWFWPWQFQQVEDNAHRLGQTLRNLVERVPSVQSHKIRLIGHSLGGHVIVSALLASEWKGLKIEDVVLLGTAVCEDDFVGYSPEELWLRILSQIRGTLFNCYSRLDLALDYRQRSRCSNMESIGRSKAALLSSRIKNIAFTGRLPDQLDHSYLDIFERVINRVYPDRLRSTSYPIEVQCDCPHCDQPLVFPANEDTDCPRCGISFEYRTGTERCYWEYRPELMECPRCEGSTGILIQESNLYRCQDCGHWTSFERTKRRISYRLGTCGMD